VRNLTGEAELLALIRDRIVDAYQPVRLVLFGSRARGDAPADSDVDLLVVLPSVSDKRRLAVELRRLLRDLPVGKDIVVTTPDEIAARGGIVGSLLRSALREGRVLFEQP